MGPRHVLFGAPYTRPVTVSTTSAYGQDTLSFHYGVKLSNPHQFSHSHSHQGEKKLNSAELGVAKSQCPQRTSPRLDLWLAVGSKVAELWSLCRGVRGPGKGAGKEGASGAKTQNPCGHPAGEPAGSLHID